MTDNSPASAAAPDAVSPDLTELARELGVATSYEDAHGVNREIPARTLRAVLAAMGVETEQHDDGHDDNDDNAAAADGRALREIRLRPWRRVLPPTVVAWQGTATSFAVHVPRGATVSVSVSLEEGGSTVALAHSPGSGTTDESVERRDVDGTVIERRSVRIPDSLPPGWHRLLAVVVPPDSGNPGAADPVEATLLIAPASIPVPAGLDRRRAVGLAAQLYQIRSERSWGVGDLDDLTELASWAGRDHDADFVLVNPMHAAEPYPPVSPSPYLPTTRRFASPLYLRPERIPEYSALADEQREQVDRLARSAAGANSEDRIDRDESWSAKLDALRIVHSVELSPERAAGLRDFVTAQGQGLHRFATWCALAREHGPDWTAWPAELQAPDSPAVAAYARDQAPEVRFHEWLQWQVTEQRARAQNAALESGMRLGILHDLAVGVHPTGADAWALRHSLARGVSVGAPPDVYNQRGQDWSQPPLRPDALAEEGYATMRDIVRAALRDAGGVRIDHILGLFRLWWIPQGMPPTEGTYVHYDQDAMLAVLALEASRAGAVVVGEDLGTVAPGVREELSRRGILGTSVMWFEQDEDGPVSPEDYRELCMASVTTHDLPPTAGYADLVHVDIRDDLGQLTGDPEAERRDAADEIRAFIDAVRERDLLDGDSGDDLVVALHGFLAASPSLLYAVSVSDLVGDRRPVNMPGTSDEYPNWRVPLSGPDGEVLGLDDLRSSSLAAKVMSAAMGEQSPDA